MPEYSNLKLMHVGFVLSSVLLFCWRGFYAVQGRYTPKLWVRVAIHGVDTLLLASGVLLAFILSLNPLTESWLGAKLVALVLYVLMGARAIRGPTVNVRVTCFALSLLIFAYIVAVAWTKNPVIF